METHNGIESEKRRGKSIKYDLQNAIQMEIWQLPLNGTLWTQILLSTEILTTEVSAFVVKESSSGEMGTGRNSSPVTKIP